MSAPVLLTFSAAIFRAVTSLLFSFSSARKLASPAREYRQCLNCDVSWYGVGPGWGRATAGVAEPDGAEPGEVDSVLTPLLRDGPASFVILWMVVRLSVWIIGMHNWPWRSGSGDARVEGGGRDVSGRECLSLLECATLVYSAN